MFLMQTSILGLKNVIGNMSLASLRIQKATARGLKKGGLYLQRESVKIVPVKFGNLKGSAITRDVGTLANPDVVVGYGRDAKYAVYVHEDPNARHKKGKRYKFLEEPARTKRRQILRIVRDTIKFGV